MGMESSRGQGGNNEFKAAAFRSVPEYTLRANDTDRQSEITVPAGPEDDLPAEQYYDYTGPPPANADYAEICTVGDTPERTPYAVWHGPWTADKFPGGPRRRDRRTPERDWREPLPPPEPPRIIPLLENMTTPKQRAAARERRIGAKLLEWQRRLGLMD
jgi:hypothetical protein